MKPNNEYRENGLYGLAMKRLKELIDNSNTGGHVIRFPAVFGKLCRNFSMEKDQVWEVLFLFRDLGFIEIVPYQGIRVVDTTIGIQKGESVKARLTKKKRIVNVKLHAGDEL